MRTHRLIRVFVDFTARKEIKTDNRYHTMPRAVCVFKYFICIIALVYSNAIVISVAYVPLHYLSNFVFKKKRIYDFQPRETECPKKRKGKKRTFVTFKIALISFKTCKI